jgi:TM2 domain-containing membrane protein YozV
MSDSNTQVPESTQSVAGVGEKSFTTTWLLSLLLGVFGIDRFYLGKIGTGVLKLITAGGLGIWYLIDLIILLTGGTRDKNGLSLANEPQAKKKEWIISAAVIVVLVIAGSANANSNGSSSVTSDTSTVVEEEVEE